MTRSARDFPGWLVRWTIARRTAATETEARARSSQYGRLSRLCVSPLAFQFGIEDGPGICIQSLTLDDTYSHLHFARSAGFNVEQTKVAFEILTRVREQLSSPSEEGQAGLEQVFAEFKRAVMANAAVVRGKQPAAATAAAAVASPALSNSVSGASLASPGASGRPGSTSGARPGSSSSKGGLPQPIALDAPVRPGSRGGSAAKAGTSSPSSSSRSSAAGALGSPTSAGAGAKSTPRGSAAIAAAAAAAEEAAAAEAAAAESAAALAALPPRTFSLDNIRALTAYATSGYFQHYRLYQAVFNQRLFRPRKHTVVERLRVETVIPDGYPSLEWAVELGAVRAAQQQQLQAQQQQAEESKQKAAAERGAERKEESKDGGVQRWSAAGSSRPASAAFPGADRSASRLDGVSDDSDEIGVLVRQHMAKARAQMLALIQDNDKLLDAKLRAVEQKVGVGAGAAATTPAHSTTKSSSSAKKR